MGLSECDSLPLCLRISFRTAGQELRTNPCFLRCDGAHVYPFMPLPRSGSAAPSGTAPQGRKRECGCALAPTLTVEPIYPRGRPGTSVCACAGGPRGLARVCVAASRAAGHGEEPEEQMEEEDAGGEEKEERAQGAGEAEEDPGNQSGCHHGGGQGGGDRGAPREGPGGER